MRVCVLSIGVVGGGGNERKEQSGSFSFSFLMRVSDLTKLRSLSSSFLYMGRIT